MEGESLIATFQIAKNTEHYHQKCILLEGERHAVEICLWLLDDIQLSEVMLDFFIDALSRDEYPEDWKVGKSGLVALGNGNAHSVYRYQNEVLVTMFEEYDNSGTSMICVEVNELLSFLTAVKCYYVNSENDEPIVIRLNYVMCGQAVDQRFKYYAGV